MIQFVSSKLLDRFYMPTVWFNKKINSYMFRICIYEVRLKNDITSYTKRWSNGLPDVFIGDSLTKEQFLKAEEAYKKLAKYSYNIKKQKEERRRRNQELKKLKEAFQLPLLPGTALEAIRKHYGNSILAQLAPMKKID